MMKTSILVLCLAVAAFADDILTDKELQQLKESDFVDIPMEEITRPSDVQPRDLKDTLLQMKKLCECVDKTCNCCYQVSTMIVPIYACVYATIDPATKMFDIKVTVAGVNSYTTRIEGEKLEKACKKVPKVKDAEICLYVTLEENVQNQVSSCMSVDISYKSETVAHFNFQCLHYDTKTKKLSYTKRKIEKDSVAKMNIKNPVELIQKLLKAIMNG